MTYDEFFEEVVRLYNEDANGEFYVMHLANEYPELYAQYCEEEGLLD
jgi:hypothetical protein